jgi:hypothetical protein
MKSHDGRFTSESSKGNRNAVTHGLSSHILYGTWLSMKTRCYNEKAFKFPHYGGRGIKVCERWLHSFPDFLKDMGERPVGMTLSRIDNDDHYSPDNCEWETYSDQNRNRRKYKRKIKHEL